MCKHCLNNAGDPSQVNYQDELSHKEIISVANDIASLKPGSICICGGEPLVRKNEVFTILQIMKKAEIPVNMVSNGLLVTDEIAELLHSLNLNSIQISLDGLGGDHDRFRNSDGAFEKTIKSIKILLKHKNIVTISFVPNIYNHNTFETFVAFVRNLGCNVIRMMPLTPLGRAKENLDLLLNSTQTFMFVQKVNFMIEKYPDMSIVWGDPYDHMYKILINRRKSPVSIGILANGDLSVTTYFNFIVGNIRRHLLSEYWSHGLNSSMTNKTILNKFKNSCSLKDLNSSEKKVFLDICNFDNI